MSYFFKNCPFCQKETVLGFEFVEFENWLELTCPDNILHKALKKEVWAWIKNGKEVSFNLRINGYQLHIDYESSKTYIFYDNKDCDTIYHTREEVFSCNYVWNIPKSEKEFLSKLKTILIFM